MTPDLVAAALFSGVSSQIVVTADDRPIALGQVCDINPRTRSGWISILDGRGSEAQQTSGIEGHGHFWDLVMNSVVSLACDLQLKQAYCTLRTDFTERISRSASDSPKVIDVSVSGVLESYLRVDARPLDATIVRIELMGL